jgi:hypothetical protein
MILHHVAARLYGTPLLIAQPKLEIILSALGDGSEMRAWLTRI